MATREPIPVVLRGVTFTLLEAQALVMKPPKEGDSATRYKAYQETQIMREVARSGLRSAIKEAQERVREREREQAFVESDPKGAGHGKE